MFTYYQSPTHSSTLPHLRQWDASSASSANTAANAPPVHQAYIPAQNGSFRQRAELPQHYARPVRGAALRPRTTHTHVPYNSSPEVSEHMLRRKTPNGTLAAGYDGSPVQWTKRPYSIKHFASPASGPMDQIGYPPKATNNSDTNSSTSVTQSWHTGNQESPPTHFSAIKLHEHSFPCNNSFLDDTSDRSWNSSAVLPIGIDSVLNQSSLYHNDHNPAESQNVPTVLQPMWPPSLDATTSHKIPSYGPQQPNEAMGPYHQNIVQDSGHQGQQVSHRTGNPSASKQHQQSLQCRHILHDPYLQKQYLATYPPVEQERTKLKSSTLGNERPNRDSSVTLSRAAAQASDRSEIPLAYRRKPCCDRTELDSRDPNNTQRCARYRASDPFGPSLISSQVPSGSHNGQFKEKVLEWAQKVYDCLLASIELARRRSFEPHVSAAQQYSSYYPQPRRRHHTPWPYIYGRNGRPFANVNLSVKASTSWQKTHDGSSQPARSPEGFIQTPLAQKAHNSPSSSVYPNTIIEPQFSQRWPNHDLNLLDHISLTQASYVSPQLALDLHASNPPAAAVHAIEILGRLCEESQLRWTEGMLLVGSLAYGLGKHSVALNWYLKVLQQDSSHVEAMSNLAATLLALNRRSDAEHYWFRSVRLAPSYFEATEHLIGLLHEGHRSREAVKVVDFVERALRIDHNAKYQGKLSGNTSKGMLLEGRGCAGNVIRESLDEVPNCDFAIPPSDNGRMLALVHGKGNMLYQLGDNAGAAQAFESAVLIGAGRNSRGIRGLIDEISSVFSEKSSLTLEKNHGIYGPDEPILLTPDRALETARLVFAPEGRLPGLTGVIDAHSQRAAVSIVSNSLLSLAKIYQDGMSSSGASANSPGATSGVQEILSLYYLSLSLQPSPSTANNVGILLASVQQSSQSRSDGKLRTLPAPAIPGIVPGSGIALALSYYEYGLQLDSRHAHLYTNLGSLFKDIGQLHPAIKMYEKAVECDGNFDIALANLANAVKDQGKVSDAIVYYRRAVMSNPDFAEAVCGLANALNSVCNWNGRGGIRSPGNSRDRWHVGEAGELYDSKDSTIPGGGWIERVVTIVNKQLQDGEGWGKGVLQSVGTHQMLRQLVHAYGRNTSEKRMKITLEHLANKPWEGAKVVRLVERATKILTRRIYWQQYIEKDPIPATHRIRPQLPPALAVPSAPTVLPFHTFTCPLSARQIRKISQRNGLRVSCSTLRAPWLSTRVYDPPAPPDPHLNVGYISSDFNNHPLAHLMQSVFGLHDGSHVRAFCYATTVSDGSVHRQQIEKEAPVFHDASLWSLDRLVNQVVSDNIHILVNLNGYTRGAKNEVFAARPAPIQMSFMGFAGTLGAEWCDYLLADKIAIPPQTLRPWRRNLDLTDHIHDGNYDDDDEDWVYGENIIFAKDTFFCCDHRQSAPDAQEVQLSWAEERRRRWKMRKDIFPELPDDAVILANFNQLYKVCLAHWLYVKIALNASCLGRANNIQDMASHPLTCSESYSMATKVSGAWRRKS